MQRNTWTCTWNTGLRCFAGNGMGVILSARWRMSHYFARWLAWLVPGTEMLVVLC
jgi:hypothetical protein